MNRGTILALTALAFMTACNATTGGYTFLHTEQADKSYTQLPILMNDGVRPIVYLKTFEQTGQIGLCGYYTNVSGTHDTFFCSWLQQAGHVELKGENVASAGFIIKSEENNGPYSGRAACVLTNVPYSVDLAYSTPRIKGFAVRVEDDDC